MTRESAVIIFTLMKDNLSCQFGERTCIVEVRDGKLCTESTAHQMGLLQA
jgi:hypothetical protein